VFDSPKRHRFLSRLVAQFTRVAANSITSEMRSDRLPWSAVRVSRQQILIDKTYLDPIGDFDVLRVVDREKGTGNADDDRSRLVPARRIADANDCARQLGPLSGLVSPEFIMHKLSRQFPDRKWTSGAAGRGQAMAYRPERLAAISIRPGREALRVLLFGHILLPHRVIPLREAAGSEPLAIAATSHYQPT
jgi:hypothetical protein